MKDFFIANWQTILIIAIFLGYIIYLAVTRQWDKLRGLAYKLIIQAEKCITGTKKGQERFEYVLGRLYTLIPGWMQFFISEQSLREKLQEWFNELKDYLDNGKIDSSYKPTDASI